MKLKLGFILRLSLVWSIGFSQNLVAFLKNVIGNT